MASKALYRILNRNKDVSFSFDNNENEGTENSIPSLDFEEKRIGAEIESEPDTSVFDDKQKESFSRHRKNVFDFFEKEKEFTGVITNVDSVARIFWANLISKDDSINREVKFSMEDLSPEECNLVVEGKRIIYIFGKQYCNGTISNTSKLYFRSDLTWTNREIEMRKEEAKKLFDLLNQDNSGDND